MKQFYKIWIKYSALGSCLLLALAMSVMLKQYFLPVENDFFVFLFVIPSIALICFCDQYKKNALLYIGLLALLTTIIGISYFFNRDLLKKVIDGIRWFLQYDGEEATYKWQYGRGILFAVCLITTFISYLICHMGKWQYFVDGILIFLGGLFTVLHLSLDKLGGICIAMYLLGELSKLSYALWYKQKDRKRAEKTAVYLLPLFIVCGCMMGLLPYKETPIKWERVKKAYVFVKDQVEKVSYEVASLLDQAGDGVHNGLFVNSSGGRLGGDLKTEDREWIRVKLSSKTHDAVYMVGSCKEVYEDNKWLPAEDMQLPIKEQQLDYYELMYSLLRQKDLKYYDSVLRQRRIEVTYANIKTKAIFVPSKTKNVQDIDIDISYLASGVENDKLKCFDTKYNCSFAEWNMNSSRMIALMKDADTFSYESLNAFSLGMFKTQAKIGSERRTINEKEDQTLDLNGMLAERARYIKAHYTQLPDDFSEDVRVLAQKITADCDNNYDKVMALKNYLKQYTYTTTPGSLPKGKELSSYFLLESQKGYCTYFATSLVTMGRSLGIPMRYVEGAILDYKVINDKQQYVISSTNAHAWAEAYFEGVGWVIFEATPGYDELSNSSWPTEESVAAQKEEQRRGKTVEEVVVEAKPEVPIIEAQAVKEKKPVSMQELLSKIGLILAIILVVFIFFSIMLILYIKWRYRCYYQKGNSEQCFRVLFYEMLGMLSEQGLRLGNNETLMSFEERIRESKGEEASNILVFCKEYRGVRYGGYQITQEAVMRAKDVCNKLIDECKKQRGKLRTYLCFLKNQYEIIKKIE